MITYKVRELQYLDSNLDCQIPADEFKVKGKLSSVCARIVLKILFFARIARPDVLGACNQLSREVSRWTAACDRRLLRLISYIHSTTNWVIRCMVGDKFEDIKLAVYSDASFAGDTGDSKSTTGGVLCLVGPRTFIPLNWICKKQGAVSHSSTEAEIIGLDTMMRMEGIPGLHLWSQIMSTASGKPRVLRKCAPKESAWAKYDTISTEYADWVPPSMPALEANTKLIFVQDNDAVIKMVIKSRAPMLKHVARTHRIDLDWLFERLNSDPAFYGRYIHTKLQIADMLTKGHFTSEQWNALCSLIRVGAPPKNHVSK